MDTLNRIYQGRVVACKNEQGETIVDFEKLLLKHHEIFQDAVNYYLFCLVAMSQESDPIFGKIRQQILNVWDDFYRNGLLRLGLKHSLARTLNIKVNIDGDKGINFVKDLVLEHTSVPPEILQEALSHIAQKSRKKVRDYSKTYFSQLCSSSFNGNFDLDPKALEQNNGYNQLLDALYSENPLENINKIIPKMDIGWCGIKTQTGKYFEGQDAVKTLKEAIEYFIDNPTSYITSDSINRLNFYLSQVDKLGAISFGRNNKANMKKRNAMWLLRFFPDDFTIGLMKTIIKKKKNENEKNLLAPKFSDDPIKLSRGEKGYVFKPFTDLPIWKSNTAWSIFDKEAFCKALTIIDQFNTKVTERNLECEKYEKAVAWMEGRLNTHPSIPDVDNEIDDNDESNQLPKLTSDTRYIKLNNLLNRELAINNFWTEEEVIEYGLSERTIRSFSKLKSQWNKILLEAEQKQFDDFKLFLELKKVLDKFQSDNRESMGSASLFQALCKPENICIWEDIENSTDKYISHNILKDTAKYNYYKQKIKQLQEPIQITPADARWSRRPSNLLAISSGKEFGHKSSNSFIAKLAIITESKIQPQIITIHYSAPRLHRDGLCNNENNESYYLPPILQSIFSGQEFEQKFNSALDLMPDWDKNNQLRILLNFQVKISIDKILNNFDQRFRNKNEFYDANNTNCALLWPDYNLKDKTPSWFNSNKDFYFVSVDLGQRTAGALVRIKVSQKQEKHSVFIGNDGKNDWFATRVYSELLRLPGEDAKILKEGKFVKEEYGKKGRLADPTEKDEAITICSLLEEDDSILFHDIDDMIPYFPIQNDKLLIVLRRSIGKLKVLNRWLWLMKEPENEIKIKDEMESAKWLKVKTFTNVIEKEQKLRHLLPKILVQIANRILPVYKKTWTWQQQTTVQNITFAQLSLIDDLANKPKIRGQRGLSFARLNQLEELRKRCQSLNRVLMRAAGSEPQTIAQMREIAIPDCCPEILRRLEEMKEQRINMTSNMILAQALGVRHKAHDSQKVNNLQQDFHGEYENIPNVEPASFIVLENLSRYKFTQDRSPYENSKLMKWSHRALIDKLKMLCQVTGIPIIEVNAAYSSKFTAESIPGFRALECNSSDLKNFNFLKKSYKPEIKKLLDEIEQIHQEMCKYNKHATSLMPKEGGEIFIPYCGTDDIKQADINAAFNIGLRAITHGKNFLINNRITTEYKKGIWTIKPNAFQKLVGLNKITINYENANKLSSGTFFVIGCTPQAINIPEEKTPNFIETSDDYKFLMFGNSIWYNLELQLKRCKKLNQNRLNKLQNQQETLF